MSKNDEKSIEITSTVAEDSNVNQIEVIVDNLNVRSGAGKTSKVLGFASIGFYNYSTIKHVGDLDYYEIADGQWIASNEGWTVLHEADSNVTDSTELQPEAGESDDDSDDSANSDVSDEEVEVSNSNEVVSTPEVPEDKHGSDLKINYVVGQMVSFLGGRHYSTCDSELGATVRPSLAVVIDISKQGKHRIKLQACNSSGRHQRGVYGWVDEAAVKYVANKKNMNLK